MYLGLTDESDDFPMYTNGFGFWEEPPNWTDQQYQPSNEADFEDFASPTPLHVTDEPQAEELIIHHYPIRSTRSNISSYYETPLRNRFWNTRRNSSSRSRHES